MQPPACETCSPLGLELPEGVTCESMARWVPLWVGWGTAVWGGLWLLQRAVPVRGASRDPPGPEPGLGAAAVPEQVTAGICINWKGNGSKKRYPKLFEHLRG